MEECLEVLVLQHSRLIDGEDVEEVKFIGVFSDRNSVDKAIAILKCKPGFIKFPDGFSIDKYKINSIEWLDGFECEP